MKKYYFNFFISAFLIFLITKAKAQVGINTAEPTATLEVVSKNPNPSGKVLKANNLAGQTLIDVNLSGDLTFGKAIMPAGNPGNAGQYLISQGANVSPVWGNLPKGATVQIFNAQRDSNNTTVNQPGYYIPISFTMINSNIDPYYGTWSTATNTFTVARKGVYTITAGFTSYDVNCSNISYSVDWEEYANAIYLVTPEGGSVNGVTTITYNNSYSGYITQSLVLNSNSTIQIQGNSNACSWKQGPSFISILYSELP